MNLLYAQDKASSLREAKTLCSHFPDGMYSPCGELRRRPIHGSLQSPLDRSLTKSCRLSWPHVTDEQTQAQESTFSALNPWLPP